MGLRSIHRQPLLILFAFHFLNGVAPGQPGPQSRDAGPAELKKLTLEQLSQIEVTTTSKEPAAAFRTAAAISVLTRDDKWAIGIRGLKAGCQKPSES